MRTKPKAPKSCNTAKAKGKSNLSADDVYGILSAYNIPVADWRLATNAEDAEKAAAEIGYPVVVKADAESIVHKSDMGGVAVDLQDGDAVRSAIENMQQNFSAKDLRFFVQKVPARRFGIDHGRQGSKKALAMPLCSVSAASTSKL